jgi:pectinesterase
MLPKEIVAVGWSNWDNPSNEKTAFYAEYKNKGVGGNSSHRAKWSKQLADAEVKEYTIANIFSNANSIPDETNWYNINSRPFDWPKK